MIFGLLLWLSSFQWGFWGYQNDVGNKIKNLVKLQYLNYYYNTRIVSMRIFGQGITSWWSKLVQNLTPMLGRCLPLSIQMSSLAKTEGSNLIRFTINISFPVRETPFWTHPFFLFLKKNTSTPFVWPELGFSWFNIDPGYIRGKGRDPNKRDGFYRNAKKFHISWGVLLRISTPKRLSPSFQRPNPQLCFFIVPPKIFWYWAIPGLETDKENKAVPDDLPDKKISCRRVSNSLPDYLNNQEGKSRPQDCHWLDEMR